jgi:hypothetical protein
MEKNIYISFEDNRVEYNRIEGQILSKMNSHSR